MEGPRKLGYWHGCFSVVCIGVLALVGCLLYLIFAPNVRSIRLHSRDGSAMLSGRSAKLAEEIYYREHRAQNYGYTSSLADLLVHDKNLTEDREITFIWGYAGDTNYTFTTSHAKGTKTFVFTD